MLEMLQGTAIWKFLLALMTLGVATTLPMLLALLPRTLARGLLRENISLDRAAFAYTRFVLVLLGFSAGMMYAALQLLRDAPTAIIVAALSIGLTGVVLGIVLYRQAGSIIQRAVRAANPDGQK
jgi:xanthosine utilization system XapX-like protein